MSKGNRRAIMSAEYALRQQYAQVAHQNERARQLLLAAIVSKYGVDDGAGGKQLVLSREDLINIPGRQTLSVSHGTPEEPRADVIIRLTPQPDPAPEVTDEPPASATDE